MQQTFCQNAQSGLTVRLGIIIAFIAVGLSRYTAYIASNNQKRNERFLGYQFKLRSLDKKWDRLVEHSTKQELLDISTGVHATDPKYKIDGLVSMFSNKEEYVSTLEKMKKEFHMEDI